MTPHSTYLSNNTFNFVFCFFSHSHYYQAWAAAEVGLVTSEVIRVMVTWWGQGWVRARCTQGAVRPTARSAATPATTTTTGGSLIYMVSKKYYHSGFKDFESFDTKICFQESSETRLRAAEGEGGGWPQEVSGDVRKSWRSSGQQQQAHLQTQHGIQEERQEIWLRYYHGHISLEISICTFLCAKTTIETWTFFANLCVHLKWLSLNIEALIIKCICA